MGLPATGHEGKMLLQYGDLLGPNHLSVVVHVPDGVFNAVGNDDKESHTCKVAWGVYWDKNSKRWFLPKLQSGCLDHSGHTYTLPQNVPIQSKFVPEDELKIAQDALGAKISATASGSLLKNRTGIDLNWHQLQHLKTKDKNNNTSGGKNSAHATATDRLLADLKADPEVSFVCLFGDVSSAWSSYIQSKLNERTLIILCMLINHSSTTSVIQRTVLKTLQEI